MMRMVDDYLVIAGDRATAEKAMARLIEGFADCGVAVNPEKTKANFSVKPRGGGRRGREGGSAGQHLHVGADGSLWVRWCGLMVNARTLQVMVRTNQAQGGRSSWDCGAQTLSAVFETGTHLGRTAGGLHAIPRRRHHQVHQCPGWALPGLCTSSARLQLPGPEVCSAPLRQGHQRPSHR